MHTPIWHLVEGEGPLVAAAIHEGHAVREEVATFLALDDDTRRREEDPYTGTLTAIAPTRLVVTHSRFEVDLNRPPDQAVYRTPADAWGLNVWNEPPPPTLVDGSLAAHRAFYEAVERLLRGKVARYGGFVVFDLHTYNHRRGGPAAPSADPDLNPEVNVGTGTMDRRQWAPVVDAFMASLRTFDLDGRTLDVRENVKFRGGYFPRWIHHTFPRNGCALAIEVKKFFMDEWTGAVDARMLDRLREALAGTVADVMDALYQALPLTHRH